MSEGINVEHEKKVADFYQSLGINQGPRNIQCRLILLVLKKNEDKITKFAEIRGYTDQFVDRGSIGSKMKSVFQLDRLADKVQRGGYVITERELIAANFLKDTAAFYKRTKSMQTMLDRLP